MYVYVYVVDSSLTKELPPEPRCAACARQWVDGRRKKDRRVRKKKKREIVISYCIDLYIKKYSVKWTRVGA